MVETIMIFALGFLAAALIALLVIPALNQRAERLARRRAEALFPMSVAELTAEKDHLRAEFAVLQRRLERKVEEAQALKHQTMQELGRRAIQFENLENTLTERNEEAATLQADLAEVQNALVACQASASEISAAYGESREVLAALEITHHTTLGELANMRRDRDQLQASLSVTSSELARASHTLAELEEVHARVDAALTAALSEIDAKRITISDLEMRLMTQNARGDDFERALGNRHGELSDARKRLATLTKNLSAEQERGLILEQHIREVEADRDGKIHETGVFGQLENTQAKSASVANEELRRRIKQLADQILAGGQTGLTKNDGASDILRAKTGGKAARRRVNDPK